MEPRANEEQPNDHDEDTEPPLLPELPPTEQIEPEPQSADEETVAITSNQTEKQCQAAIRPPQRTRKIQVSLTNDKTVRTVSTGVQCSSLSDGVSLRVAAGLVPCHVPQPPLESDSEEEDNYDSDPDFDLDEAEEDDEDIPNESYSLRTNPPPEEEGQFLVAESSLAKLLGKCDICGEVCNPVVQFTRGTMIGTVSKCVNGHTMQWESQTCYHGMPWSNLLLAGAIVFSGINSS